MPSLTNNTPNALPQDSTFHRRFSPRLHPDLATKPPPHVCVNLSVSPTVLHQSAPDQFQRRFSPRLHQNPLINGQENISNKLDIHTSLSPKVHTDAEKAKLKNITNGLNNGKRLSGDFQDKSSSSITKRSKHNHLRDHGCNIDVKYSLSNGKSSTVNVETSGELTMTSKTNVKHFDTASDVTGKSIHVRVKETLRIFNTYYLQFFQEDEEKIKKCSKGKECGFHKCKKCSIQKEKKCKPSNVKEKVKLTISRPDLKAISKMKRKKEILYSHKKIGHVPGIEVGFQFYSRAEMVAIGFHSHSQNGIDYIGPPLCQRWNNQNYTLPIAISIVMSGQSEDDKDNSEEIFYTDQGGHDLVGSKRQRADQTLTGGNLAMKNCREHSVPVRVIRGHKTKNSYSGKVFTYDGLYKVVNTWAEKGKSGYIVYKYSLRRFEEQPNLTTNQVQFFRECSSKTFPESPRWVCKDISYGQEDIRVRAINEFDDATIGPEGFTYLKTIQVPKSVELPPNAGGCACKGKCTNPRMCACAKLNGSDFPYVCRDGERLLVEPKDVVFECGPNCGCGPECLNRTSSRGIKYSLEVYRTRDKGWAVRSLDLIPSGAPVCEYIGLLRKSDEIDNISGNDYIFEIDCWHTINEIEGREKRYGNVPVSSDVLPEINKTLDNTPEFCIDAGSSGNVARFINHSCEPNLFVQCILSSHHDLQLARVVLFAADDIPAMQELTYDYGYILNSVIGPDGKVKSLPCFCGTSECRKRLY